MITNPENLSKDRLKAELKKRGISFNASENKKYYVDLYRNKILNTEEPAKSEFSDDEIRRSPVLSAKRTERKSASSSRKSGKQSSKVVYAQSLEDDELKDELIDLGEDPGPINALTRGVYERKLVKLLEEEEAEKRRPKVPPPEKEVPANDSFIGEWSDDGSDEDEEDGEGTVQVEQSYSYNLRRRDTPSQEAMERRQPKSFAQSPSSRQQTLAPPRHPPKYSHSSRRQQERSEACRTLWSFFLLLVVFTVVFLVYEHATVPEGKTSVLSHCIDTAYGFVMSPLMEKQEVATKEAGKDAESTPPPPPPPPPASEKPPPPDDKPKDTPTEKPKDKPPAPSKKPADKPKDTPTEKPKDQPPPPTDPPKADKKRAKPKGGKPK